MNEELQQQQQQQQRQQRVEQLQQLQTWGNAQGDALLQQKKEFTADVIEFQTHYDEAVIAQMQQALPHAQIVGAAPVGQPPVQQPAAQEGYKARRERQKKRNAALKVCPVGDEYTFDISNQIKHAISTRNLAQTPELTQLANEQNCDMRMLKTFCQEFSLNKAGQPATDEDALILEQNKQFMRDYCNGDAQQRRPLLDRCVNDVLKLNFRFTPDMLSDENIREHMLEYKAIADKLTYVENLQKENPQYFASMPQVQRELYAAQISIGAVFCTALGEHLRAKGISLNDARIYGYDSQESIEGAQPNIQVLDAAFQAELVNLSNTNREVMEREAMRLTQTDMFDELLDGYRQQDEQFVREYGVSLPGGGSELIYADIAKYRDMIADNPQQYAQNKELIDRLFNDYYKLQSQRGEMFMLQRKLDSIVIDNQVPAHVDPMRRALARAADKINDRKVEDDTALAHYGNAIMDALSHLLRGRPMSNSAAAVIERYRQPQPDAGVNGLGE